MIKWGEEMREKDPVRPPLMPMSDQQASCRDIASLTPAHFTGLGLLILPTPTSPLLQGYFARITTQDANEPVWIIPDARRPTDIEYFTTKYPGRVITGPSPPTAPPSRPPAFNSTPLILLVRVEADESVRQKRGYVWTAGIDDMASECALDKFPKWTFKISNNGGDLEPDLAALLATVRAHL